MSERGSFRSTFESLADDHDFQNLSPLAQAVFWTLKLKLGQYGIGVFYVSTLPDLHRKAKPKQITAALEELEQPKRPGAASWIRREHNIVWIVNGLRFEPSISVDNRNHRTGALKFARTLPQLPIVAQFIAYYELDGERRMGSGMPSASHSPSPTLSHSLDPQQGQPLGGGITDTDSDTDTETDTETITTIAPAVRLAAAANRGLSEHEDRPQRIPRIIATNASTMQATAAIEKHGVPLDFAEAAIYQLAKDHNANGQVTSLKYFVEGVKRRWDEKRAADEAATSTVGANGKRAKWEEEFLTEDRS